jgi:hypothetical protein
VPGRGVELNNAGNLGKGDGADQGGQPHEEDGVVSGLPSAVGLKLYTIFVERNKMPSFIYCQVITR